MSSLSMWTVYDRPRDYPNSYVARRSEVTAQGRTLTSDLMVSGDLDLIRDVLQKRGLHRIPRYPNDVPCIVEVWL